ncbi:MAG: COG1361 S-layer family protein, partial [Candidatus Nanoarchaeia archaeon]
SDIVFESSDMTGDITPNSEFSVTLNVRNEGEGVARNIKLVSSSRDFLLKGTDIVSIEEIQSGALREIALTFLAGSSVEKGVYSLPINIQYEDHDGTVHETTQKISVKVIDKAKLSIKDVKIEPSKIRPGDDITVQVRIENVGDGDANNIKMTLESEIEGSKESYIGRLEKDDDSPAFISGTVLSPGEKSDTLVITYEDDLGIHTMNASVNYTVKGVSNSAYIIVGLIVVILALAGILVLTWVYRVCKCAAKGHKCPSFKNHVHKTIENATSAFKK